MTRVERAREVFAFCEDDRDPECDWIDHKPTWCGDCYACADCGLVFVRITDAAREVAEERKRIAAELRECFANKPVGLYASIERQQVGRLIEELEAE